MKTVLILFFVAVFVLALSACSTVKQPEKPRGQSSQLLESAGQFLDSLLIYTINR